MAHCFSRSAAALVVLGGVALIAAPALASDISVDGDVGAYDSFGPGASALPDVDVDVGPFGARLLVSPEIGFGTPVDYAPPATGWAPIAPEAEIAAGAE
jgi:hypothetical protein